MPIRSFEGRPWRGRTTAKVHAVDTAIEPDILGSYTALCSSTVKSTKPVIMRPKKAITCLKCIRSLNRK